MKFIKLYDKIHIQRVDYDEVSKCGILSQEFEDMDELQKTQKFCRSCFAAAGEECDHHD